MNDKILLVLPIQLSSVSHKMVVKELKHFSCNTEFGNRLAHPRLFPFEVLQVIKSFRPKKEKLQTGIDVFFGSFGSTVLQKADQEIGFFW